MDFGGIFGAFSGWLSSGMFWLVMAILLTIGVTFLLVIQKRRKLKYECLELINFGNNRVGINRLKAGIFKKKSALFNLWDYGTESTYKTSDGRIIQEANSEDLFDIFSKKGFIVRRKDDDPKILVPITNVTWSNERALFEIAPADFRDASVNIIDTASKETNSWADKYLPYIMLGGMVIFFIVGFILASQFFNRTVDKAGEILTKVAENAGSTTPGASP
jgi:hypothetical protein